MRFQFVKVGKEVRSNGGKNLPALYAARTRYN